jgi:hypothetical protein
LTVNALKMKHTKCVPFFASKIPEVIFRENRRRTGINIKIKCESSCNEDSCCPFRNSPTVTVDTLDEKPLYAVNPGVRKILYDDLLNEWTINFWPEYLSSKMKNSSFVMEIYFGQNMSVQSTPYSVMSKSKLHRKEVESKKRRANESKKRSANEISVETNKLIKQYASEFMHKWIKSTEGQQVVQSFVLDEIHSIIQKHSKVMRMRKEQESPNQKVQDIQLVEQEEGNDIFKLNTLPDPPKFDFAPQYDSGPQLNFAPQYDGGPQLNFAPQYENGSQLNFASQYEDGPQLNFAHQYEGGPQLNFAHQYEGGPQLNFAHQYEGGPQLNFAHQYEGGPQLNFAPQYEGGPQYQFVQNVDVGTPSTVSSFDLS